MDTGARLTLPKAGAFGENTVSKNKGSLDEKPNFGSKLGGMLLFHLSVSALKAGICTKKIVENGKYDLSYRGSSGESDQRAHISMWGLWVTQETISKSMESLGDSSAENRGSLGPYICVTSIMGVPLGAYSSAITRGAIKMPQRLRIRRPRSRVRNLFTASPSDHASGTGYKTSPIVSPVNRS